MTNKLNLDNIVVLSYAPNNCYTKVVEAREFIRDDKELAIDLEDGFWHYRGKKDIPIGNSIHHEHGCRSGVIGVYDRTNIKHLNLMLSASKEETREEPMISAGSSGRIRTH